MTRFLPILLASLFVLTGCSTPENEPGTMRYVLHDQYISSWEENGSGVTVHLNDNGARKLHTATKYRKGYPLEIYANRCLIETQTINGKSDRDLTLDVSGDTRDRLIANLPPGKKS